MRIVHVYKDYHPTRGGIEHHIQVLAEAQAAAGHSVRVQVASKRGQPARSSLAGVEILRAPSLLTVRSMPVSPGLVRRVRRESADILHVHSPFPLGEFALRNAPAGLRVVATHHSDVVRQKWLLRLHAPFYRQFLKRADVLLPTSPTYAATSPWLRPHAAKCRVVPLGVDLQRFHPATRPAPTDAAPLQLMFAGRLRYYKGLDTLLRALAQPGAPPVRLAVCGSGPMGPAWERLRDELGLGEQVRFLGEVDDATLVRTYQQADLFVLPCNCRAEAFGTVLLEAMACALPCLTCEVGSGTSWVVRDGLTGCVVPHSDPPAMAAALRRLDRDRAALRALGEAGRRRVEADFSHDAMARGVDEAYRGG